MPPFDLPYERAWQPATLTLLHFLWQGLAVAVVLVVVLWLFRVRQPRTRYALSLLALLAMAACPLVTLAVLKGPSPKTTTVGGSPAVVTAIESPEPLPDATLPMERRLEEAVATVSQEPARSGKRLTWGPALMHFVRNYQRQLLVGWSVGVFLLSVRLLLSLIGLYWVRRDRRAIPAELRDCAGRLGKQLGLGCTPLVLASERVREALVVGFLRPMVLLPASWLMDMAPEVLEAVIAHELAHVRRWDLWVNVFQRIVETLLFYHPAVWWLSRRVRLEREMCCDELAVAVTGRRGVYVDALELVARKRFVPTEPALAPTIGGGKMVLLNRIRYIAGVSPTRDRARWWPVGALTLLVLVAMWLASTSAPQLGQGEARAEEKERAAVASDKQAAAPGELLRTFPAGEPSVGGAVGWSIAVAGNKVLAGAPVQEVDGDYVGAAYLFDGSTGKLLQTFHSPTPDADEMFSHSVAVVGNTIAVADPLDGTRAKGAGAVYLFDGTTGELLRTLQKPTPAAFEAFGSCVAAMGKNVLVGAWGDTEQNRSTTIPGGAAYLFDGTTGKLVQTFENPSTAPGGWFGNSVAAVGNNVLVGAPRDDTIAENAGAAYLFDGLTGKLLHRFKKPTAAANDHFGWCVAALGSRVLASAIGAEERAGAVYMFDSSTGKLLRSLRAPSPAREDAFGFSLAVLGNNLLVGDPGENSVSPGAAYLFDGSNGKLLHTFRNPRPDRNDAFGCCVAPLGNDVLICDCDHEFAGAVYLFKGVGKPGPGAAD